MAPHSSTRAWKIPWMKEPGRLQSMGSLRVGRDWMTSLSLFTFTHWRRKWQPTPVLLSGKSHGWRSLVGYIVHGVAKSWTQLSNFTHSYTLLCIKSLMRNHCIAQRTLLRALWWPKWEGNPKRGAIRIHIADSLCSTAETNTLLKVTILQ